MDYLGSNSGVTNQVLTANSPAIAGLIAQLNLLLLNNDISKIDAAIPLIQTQRIIAQIVLNQK